MKFPEFYGETMKLAVQKRCSKTAKDFSTLQNPLVILPFNNIQNSFPLFRGIYNIFIDSGMRKNQLYKQTNAFMLYYDRRVAQNPGLNTSLKEFKICIREEFDELPMKMK